MRTFYLRTKKDSGFGTLYVRVQRRKPALQLMISSRVQVDIPTWKKAISSTKDWQKFLRTTDGRAINAKLQAIDAAIDNLVARDIYEKEAFDEAIDDIVLAEEKERQKRLDEEAARIKAEEESARKANVILFLENYVDGMRKGEITYKGTKYAINTVKSWKNFLGILQDFYKKHPFTWDDINKSLIDKFLFFMEGNGYMVTAINKYLVTFRALVGYALEAGVHSNTKALKLFTTRRVLETDKAKEIYLTSSELQALYEMPLSGLDAVVRDVFLVGCYTCQRFSDYSRLEKENFTQTAKGVQVVKLVQQKTRNSVTIPILNDNLLTIAERYDYDIPKVNDAVLNRYIKRILKTLADEIPSLAIQERTVLTMKEREKEARGEVAFERDSKGYVVKPRYELVSSHTARRSGITNLYLTKKFNVLQMMSISGHRDIKTFTEYIKLSSDEIANEIAEIISHANNGSNEGLF